MPVIYTRVWGMCSFSSSLLCATRVTFPVVVTVGICMVRYSHALYALADNLVYCVGWIACTS